jgi:hypothetical protein
MSLSILCVTRMEPHAWPFLWSMSFLADVLHAELVVGTDGAEAERRIPNHRWLAKPVVVSLRSKGYVESVLDTAVAACSGDYVLRLDDDERCSVAMVRWLVAKKYEAEPHWKFARAHLWRNDGVFILQPPLWPDHQTRLSVRDMAGGRTTIHAGSPHGGGALAPVVLEHHKFLVKQIKERREIVARYDALQPGAGTAFAAFSVPEDVCTSLFLAPLGDGTLRDYQPDELASIVLREAA